MTVRQQPPFLICVPVVSGTDWPGVVAGRVEALLDGLGNPASKAMEAALNATGVIHFLSLSVVWDQNSKDPPILLADVAGDGTPQSIIAALVEHAGALLLPVYRAARGTDNLDALKALLEGHWVSAVGASLPLWPHLATGLPFQGTPDLTVDRIRKDEAIAQKARTAVYGPKPPGPSSALSYVGAARMAAGVTPNPKTSPRPLSFMASNGIPDRSGNPTAAILSLVVFDWSFLFVILFTIFNLNVHDLLTPILKPETGSSYGMMLSIPLAIAFGFIINSIIKISKQIFSFNISSIIAHWIAVATFLFIFPLTWSALDLSTFLSKEKWIPMFVRNLHIQLLDWLMAKVSGILHFHLFAWWVGIILGFLSLVLFLMLLAGVLLGILYLHESGHKSCDADPDPALLAEIMRRENLKPHKQNHMIGVSQIPLGFFRRFVSLPVALYVVSVLVRAGLFQKGFLSRVGTIHFAQWVNIPGTWKLVFVADYDGSWQSYLEDFITLAPGGASAIWSNTNGFPKTRWLFQGGAADGDRFKRWGRRQMIPTRFWYSAYPHLTATDIRLNAEIRRGLEAKGVTTTEAEAWLKLFGSAPRPVSDIETDQIQGLALGGYRNLYEGALLAVSFCDDQGAPIKQTACRTWLAGVCDQIDFGVSDQIDSGLSDQVDSGDAVQSQSAMAVALSASGLERVGLGANGPLAAQFSPAFTMGMASESRANVLGDVDVLDDVDKRNAPEHWTWGGPKNPVDAVLLIYATDQATLQAQLAVERDRCNQTGLKPPKEITLHRWPPKGKPITEPFGFVDGISQPSIRGLLSSRRALAIDLLEPGEFILGYPDGRKQFPSTPQILAANDPDGLLPDLPPEFPSPPSNQAVRDLGRNGSYLVIRQLKQDVNEYNKYINAAASTFGSTPEWVAAKMVGRWYNGAPLVLSPQAPPASYNPFPKDENFLFGRDDPQGFACPFGAHIRRANPRDQFDADDKLQMSITNRHRIIRRGRSYVDGDDSGTDPQGLLFMCLNADIERQFEFLQQTWIGSTSFGSLRDETDPLTAMSRTNGTYSIPSLGGPKRLSSMPSFVSMLGGGYFFLPSRQALAFLGR